MLKRTLMPLGIILLAAFAFQACENEEGLTVNWTGFEAFADHDVHGVLDPVDEFADALVNRIGPFDETIGDDGEATHKVEYGGNLANWAFYYFVDGNENGVCDPEDRVSLPVVAL